MDLSKKRSEKKTHKPLTSSLDWIFGMCRRPISRIASYANVFFLIVVVSITVYTGPAAAQQLPLWELGVGAAGLRIPAYRGSSNITYFGSPFPYFIYRGERLRIDGEGVSGRLFNLDRVRMDISLGGNVPVPREKNGLRAGMPGLNPVAEVGPTLNIRLDDKSVHGQYFGLHLPWRPVISGDGIHPSSMEYQGWVFAPHVEWQSLTDTSLGNIGARLTAGPLFGDKDYHNYFYRVDSAYVDANRTLYESKGGYSGFRATGTLTLYANRNASLSLYMRYDELTGAVFTDSPLVADKHYFLAAVTGIWVFWRSARPVGHI